MQQLFNTLGCATLSSSRLLTGRYIATAECSEHLVVGVDASVELILHNIEGELRIDLERGAKLRLVRLTIQSDCNSMLRVTLNDSAECYATDVLLSASAVGLDIKLEGQHSHIDVGGVFLVSGEERASVTADVAHRTEDTTSRIKYKGVASGLSRGEFSGLVYVAPGAQHTDSEQLSRNVAIGKARINTKPQLEIYADDVRCSHGATVGQLDEQAVLYMRQRGLSLEMAQRLQIEGFVSDVVLHSAIEECRDELVEVLNEKLQTL